MLSPNELDAMRLLRNLLGAKLVDVAKEAQAGYGTTIDTRQTSDIILGIMAAEVMLEDGPSSDS